MNQKIILVASLVLLVVLIAYVFLWVKFGFFDLRPQKYLAINNKAVYKGLLPIKAGHRLYWEYEAAFVPSGRLYDLDLSSKEFRQIKSFEELSPLVGTLENQIQAEAFVKFITSTPARHLLESYPFRGIEPHDTYLQIPEPIAKLLYPTRVEPQDGGWLIERDLFLYPDNASQAPARFVRARETISKDNQYSFNIVKVIMEGDSINALLPYYK